MFTGIVTAVGSLLNRSSTSSDDERIRITVPYKDLILGESVAINGVCLTVIETEPGQWADFFVSQETLCRSNLGSCQVFNLERAIRVGDRLSGHFVTGHVDGRGQMTCLLKRSNSYLVRFEVPFELMRYIVPHL